MVHNQHHSTDNMDPPNAQDTETVILTNNKAPTLEGGNSIKIGGMWNIKHEIRSPNSINS